MTEENLGIANLLNKIPLAVRTDDNNEDRQSSTDLKKSIRSKNSSRASTAKNEPNDFNNDEIQRKMNGVISDLSTTNDQTKDESQDPVRRQSFSLEQTTSIESTSDDEFFNPKASPKNDDVRSTSRQSNANGLNETRHFRVASPKPSSSARQSPQPVEKSSRAPSRLSQNSTVVEQTTPKGSSRRSSATEKAEPPAIISQSRKSSSKGDFLTTKSNDNLPDENDRSRLIKLGEQLQIPTGTMENERNHSPPPASTGISALGAINPLHVENEPKRKESFDTTSEKISSRRSSQTKTHSRKPSETSNKKVDEKPLSRKNSSSDQAKNTSSRRQSEEKLDTNRSVKSTNSQRENIVPPTTSAKSSRRASSIKSPEASPRKDLDLKLDLTPLERQSDLATPRASSRSKTPTEENPSQRWVETKDVPSLFTSEDEKETQRDERPKSPTAQQIDEHNQIPSTFKRQGAAKIKSGTRRLVRSTSADSFNGIPIVDDQSIDSTSDQNTEVSKTKKRVVRSKKKDVETNTEREDQSIPRSRKATGTKSTDDTDPVNVNVTVLVKKYPGDKDAETPKKKKKRSPSPKPVVDSQRETQSDTEQIVSEKQKKRRRPKRVSRKTQTYEAVFRRMNEDEHQELRTNGETEKCVQTRRSQLRPRTRSPNRALPIYLSTDAFRIEEILPKQFSSIQRNASKTSVVARNKSPQSGKILILRPTLPIHHSEAVNVQRVCLQYAIDLMPKEKNRASAAATSGKLNPLQQLEQTNHLPVIRSPTSASSAASPIPSHRPTFRDKPVINKTDKRRQQFDKHGGGTV